MKSARLPVVFGLLAAFATFFCVSGCESGPDNTEASSYFDNNPLQFTHTDLATYTLEIAWEDTAINGILETDGQTAVLTAGGGKPPYKWSVHDVSLGTIVEDGGSSAVYQRNAMGDNVVILTDKNGDRAYAAVSQP